jgi:hypothetical protein
MHFAFTKLARRVALLIITGIVQLEGGIAAPQEASKPENKPDGRSGTEAVVEATGWRPATVEVDVPVGVERASRLVLDLTVWSKVATSARVLLKPDQGGGVEIGHFTLLPELYPAPIPSSENERGTRVRLLLSDIAKRSLGAASKATIEIEVVSPRAPNDAQRPGPPAADEGELPSVTISDARILAR